MPEDQERNQQSGSRQDGGQERRDAAAQGDRSSSGAPEHSLKEREYRGPRGEEHHHTNTYIEQHKGEGR